MNQRDNFLRMMSGKDYASVPLDLPMTPPVVDEMERRLGTRSVVEAFNVDFEYAGLGGYDDSSLWRSAYLQRGVQVPDGAWVGSGGYVERPGDAASVGNAYHLTEMFHPLAGFETLEEIVSLPWHDLNDPVLTASAKANVARIQAKGKVTTVGLECSVFESSWYLRSMEQIFCDLAEGNGIAEWLFDRFMTQSSLSARAAALAGADLIRLGDDVGTQRGMMISIDLWREQFKGRLANIISASKCVENPPAIQYHSDGDISEIVDDLIEIGVDILNPVQPECMPLDTVAGRWKDRLAFSGMIGTQTTMPFGDPAAVRAAVATCERWVHEGARIVIGPTHVLEPDVPWENIVTLVESVRAIKP